MMTTWGDCLDRNAWTKLNHTRMVVAQLGMTRKQTATNVCTTYGATSRSISIADLDLTWIWLLKNVGLFAKKNKGDDGGTPSSNLNILMQYDCYPCHYFLDGSLIISYPCNPVLSSGFYSYKAAMFLWFYFFT